jgi:hypothetical protein
MLVAYGKAKDDQNYIDRAVSILQHTPQKLTVSPGDGRSWIEREECIRFAGDGGVIQQLLSETQMSRL